MVFLLHPSFSIISKIQFKAIYEKYPSPHFLRIIKFPIHGVNRYREITLFAQHCILNQQTSWDFFPRAFLLNSSQHNILHQPGGIWDAAEGSIFGYFLGILALNPLFLYESQTHPYKYLKSCISPSLIKSPEQKETNQWTEDCGRDVKNAEDLAVALCQPWSTLADCRANQVPTWCLSGAAWPPASQVMD